MSHVTLTGVKCPRCRGSDVAKLGGQRATCRPCSRSKRSVYYFCWACQRELPRTSTPDAACPLAHCALRAALLSDQIITDPNSSARGCPFFRACPTCKALLTHNGQGCPNIECPNCDTEFCFRCLRQGCFGDPFPAMLIVQESGLLTHRALSQLCTIVDNSSRMMALGL